MASKHNSIGIIFFLFVMMTCVNASAQNDIILHTIKSGETLSALAAKYSTTVGDIMRLNAMNSKSQLKIGEAIKIPAKSKTNNNVSAEEPQKEVIKQPVIVAQKPETSVTLTDVTYAVLKGQSLYSIAKQFKTTEAQLKAWNNFKDDKIKIGQVIIVGKEPYEKSTIPVNTKPQVAKPVEDKPVAVTQPVKQTSQSDELTVLNSGSAKVTKPETAPTPNVKEVSKTAPAPISSSAKYMDSEGFFAGYFNRKEKSSNTTTGDAAVFKSTSGWVDKKYYVLMNDVNQGTIVRLTVNNKSICAKVLGPLPDIKEDTGLLLRLSNAAAAVLGVEDMKFNVTVNY